MQNLAIVVPVYNGAEDLRRCLDSLARYRPRDSSILLMDDASTDPRVRPMLEAFAAAHPDVLVVEASENRGFIATVNRGVAEASTEGDILMPNSDTEVTD